MDGDELGEGDTEGVLEISKVNCKHIEFLPKIVEFGDNITDGTGVNYIKLANKEQNENTNKIKPKRKRRERNVALMSLLEKEKLSLPGSSSSENKRQEITSILHPNSVACSINENSDVKLLKPNDFITDTNIPNAFEKVGEWLQPPQECPSMNVNNPHKTDNKMLKKIKPITPVLETGSMFKRKTNTSPVTTLDTDIANIQTNNVFVPSIHASEYYQKFLERSRVQVMTQENIREKAETVMKKIDANIVKYNNQKLKPLLKQSLDDVDQKSTSKLDEEKVIPKRKKDTPSQCPPMDVRGWDLVKLPKHRHQMPEECKVCLVLCKNTETSK